MTASRNGLKIAVSFNGNIVNVFQLSKEIKAKFPDFSYECDAELVCHKLMIEMLKGKGIASTSRHACKKWTEPSP